mmetsp:Transcript_34550/g.104192  ORF Transcript_34550/g.104192 Transcript_34550/m.104192 type:complete len:407 (-) Transcript_34550:116-1336(-)
MAMDLFGLFGKPKKGASPRARARDPAVAAGSATSSAVVLVVDGGRHAADWAAVFAGARLADGRQCEVVQAGWDAIMVAAEPQAFSPSSRLLVHVRLAAASGGRGGGADGPPEGRVVAIGPSVKTVAPDAVLIRNVVYTPDADHRNQLYGLMMGATLPTTCCVNSLFSVFCFAERAVVAAELQRLRVAHGDAVFPVIAQSYFASHKEMMYTSTFPCVVKIGSAHAGLGKMIVRDHHEMEDFRSVLAMCNGKYCYAEPFLDGSYDLRIQKVGGTVRAFRRQSVSGNWKTNTGSSVHEPIEVTAEYRRWADIASTMFGGLQILSVDAIHDACTNREYILEVNDTSSGLAPDYEAEDNACIRDMIVAALDGAAAAPVAPLAEPAGPPAGGIAAAAAPAPPPSPALVAPSN